MNTSFVIIILIIFLLTLSLLFLVVAKVLERNVCKEVCAIYCNMLVYLDQLCGINNDALTSWKKYYVKHKFYGDANFNAEKKIMEDISFRIKEADSISNNRVYLTFPHSVIRLAILHKHKMNIQEIQGAMEISDAMEKDLRANLEFLQSLLNSKTTISASWVFAENRLKCFQHEANGVFYGALEDLCSFPKSSLLLYEQQYTRLKYLPIEVGLTKRKEDYLQLQEMEYKQAEALLHNSGEQIASDGEEVELIGDQLLNRQVNVFFAGSKALQTERDIFSNVVSQLQTKWKDKNINLYGYSFQNFEHEFVMEGHQCTYNEFIKSYADVIIFVLNGDVGGKTLEEFDIAMETFKKHKRPMIYVYSKLSDAENEDVNRTRDRINEESQYWQDYSDNIHLRLLIKNDLSDRMQKIFEEMIEKRREILEN